jgi:hypothetical protein
MKFDILLIEELIGLNWESDIEWMPQDLISDEIRKSADIKETYEVGRLRRPWWSGAVTYPKGSIVIYDQIEVVQFDHSA